MAQLNMITDAEFDANLQRVIKARRFETKSEALRTLVAEEAKRQDTEWEEIKMRRKEVLDRLRGSIPNDPENPFTITQLKDWLNEGMP